MFTSGQVSKYILYLCESNNIKLTANRLQIILFMLQRYYHDFHDEQLLSDRIYAFAVGPEIEQIAEIGKYNPIMTYALFKNEKSIPQKYQRKIKSFLEIFFQMYGNKTDFFMINKLIKDDAAYNTAFRNKYDAEVYYYYFSFDDCEE